MSNLSQAERDKLPDSDYGDPQGRRFPILDQSDVDAAARLIGRAKGIDEAKVRARIVAICKRKELTPPAAWVEGDTATMSADSGPTLEWVVRRALLSRAGVFPDKQIELTPADFAAAAEGFAPVPIDLEHLATAGTATVLDGHLGELRSVALGDDGASLTGEVALPRWLDDLLPPDGRKVSLAWDRASKKIVGLSLVTRPRIADATLFAAFSAATGEDGDAEPAGFAARKKDDRTSGLMQHIHDRISAHDGEMCDPDWKTADFADYPQQMKALKGIHDTAVKHGATCPGAKAGMSHTIPKGDSTVEKRDALVALFGDAIEVPEQLTDEQVAAMKEALACGCRAKERPAAPASFSETPEYAAMKAEIDRLKHDALTERLRNEAATFADGLIAARKATKAERAGILAAFVQSALDDANHQAVVAFNVGSEVRQGSRLDAFRALLESRPALSIFGEVTSNDPLPANARVLASFAGPEPADPDTPMSPERRKELLRMTPLGQAAANGLKD